MRGLITVVAAVVLGLSLTAAQQAGTATVQLTENPEWGPHLTTAEGMSLYMYLRDEPNVSNCYDRCAQNWMPLLVEGEPVAGEGVNPELLGTIEREGGGTQVTYNGWPLYTFVRDDQPGDASGQGVGNLLYLVSAEGESITEAQPVQATGEVDDRLMTQLMDEGQSIFRQICSACHGPQGGGQVGPALDGNRNLARSSYVVRMILNGFPTHGMPAFRDQFDDFQVAAAATYIRNSWSNEFGPVSPEEVSQLR